MTDDPSQKNLSGSSSAQTSVMNSACILALQFTSILNQQGTHMYQTSQVYCCESFNFQVTNWFITHSLNTSYS